MLQAPMLECLSFDLFSSFDDGPVEVRIGGRHIVEALGVAPVNVVLDESLELPFKIAGQEAVFQ